MGIETKTHRLLCGLLIVTFGCNRPVFPVNSSGSLPRSYRCMQVSVPPRIDGRLDDDVWRHAPWSEAFVDIEGDRRPRPPLTTRMKMCWDHEALYLAAEMEEPHVWATLTQRDAIVFHDPDFELFIDPDGDGRNYVEIETNALGIVFDLLLERTYRDGGPAQHDWNAEGLRLSVHVNGTLNDPRDVDAGWTVEAALPWTAFNGLTTAALPPRPGDIWRMNFSRVEWTVDVVDGRYEKRAGRPEANWVWSPQGVIDMHRPRTWGRVEFVPDASRSDR